MDLDLVRGVAEALPAWHLVFLGPVAKIGRHTLPTGTNIHYLGSKQYADITSYLAGWDVAWLPFARNDATRFISPTKTPEYLAAGKPVVSTAIRDVVHPYGERGLVQIADDVPATLAALTRLTAADDSPDRERVDAFLSTMSWDRTWRGMATLIDEAAQRRIAKRVMLDTMVTGGREATRSLPVSAAVSMSVPGGE
jgi:UDP-galactopyranose mutase